MHPLMSRHQPAPAVRTPPMPGTLPAAALPMAEVLAGHGIAQLRRLRVVSWEAGVFYQVIADTGLPRYFDVMSGRERVNGDRDYATALARHYLADADPLIVAVTRLDAFDADYHPVNRLLPVYRIDLDRPDRLRVYVATETSALATLVDARKAIYGRVFTTLHNWRFLGAGDTLRVPIAAVFVVAALVTPLLGLALHVGTPARIRRPARVQQHRTLGLVVSVTLLASATSGGFHLLKMAADRAESSTLPVRVWPEFASAALRWDPSPAPAAAEIGVVVIDGNPYLRSRASAAPQTEAHHAAHPATRQAPSASYLAAIANTAAPVDDEHYARALASTFSGRPETAIESVTAVTGFGGEYGFINKLLPVYRVTYATPNAARYYVHLDSATLAAQIDDFDYVEGWTFAHLHKWQWLEPIGRWPRDLMMMAFALGAAVVGVLGFLLFLRRPA